LFIILNEINNEIYRLDSLLDLSNHPLFNTIYQLDYNTITIGKIISELYRLDVLKLVRDHELFNSRLYLDVNIKTTEQLNVLLIELNSKLSRRKSIKP
jgi:hypothetical protein